MTAQPAPPLFQRAAIIGTGLIGSSLARILRKEGVVTELVGSDQAEAVRQRSVELALFDRVEADAAAAVRGADLVIVATPVGTHAAIAAAIGPALAHGAIVTDVGSTKESTIRAMLPALPDHACLVPGHPVAGTEKSGPDAGFADLFQGRWCILTPPPGTLPSAIEKVTNLWRRCGSLVEIMDAAHHDKILAVTSHLPHLIAYTIVGTAIDLEQSTESEVIKFSAGGFRDFTRIAASDPVMWRDVFLNNREAVLELLQRFTEDLFYLQRAIRWGDGDKLEKLFTRTRDIRRGIIDAHQA